MDEGKQVILPTEKRVDGFSKEAKEVWDDLLEEKPVLPYLIPVFLVAWILERWIISFSNWVPVFVTVWASLQYGKYRRERAVEDLNNPWRRHILCSEPSTPIEPGECLNKMLMNVWPNFMEPKLVRRVLPSVQRRWKEKRPGPIFSMEVHEFNPGTTPRMFGLQGPYWSMEGKQPVLNMGFEWNTNGMSVLIAAQLAGPLRGNTARIAINSIHVKGDLRLLPILDGQAVLYSFVNTAEVRIGLAFGTGSQSTPQMELPMLSYWLE